MSFTTIIINGRLGTDPRMSRSAAGNEFTYFPLAYDSTNRKRPHTCWLDIVGVGRVARYCNETLRKGANVFIVGYLEMDELFRDDERRRSYKVLIETIKLISSPRSASSDENDPANEELDAAMRVVPYSQHNVAKPYDEAREEGEPDNEGDEGISANPFGGDGRNTVGYDEDREEDSDDS